MPDLSQSLQGQDLAHLQIIASFWGVDLEAPNAAAAIRKLCNTLLDSDIIQEMVESLPEEAQNALDKLRENDGRTPWPHFTRQFGKLRVMGAGRRDREKPYHFPISTTEYLWYRGFLARAFFDTPDGPVEYAYIPNDLLASLPQLSVEKSIPLGRPATPPERANKMLASDHLLSNVCTFLAGLRIGLPIQEIEQFEESWLLPLPTLKELLRAADILDDKYQPDLASTQTHLEAARPKALAQLVNAWLHSPIFNDLHLVPHLQAEGNWENDPVKTRQTILGFLNAVPKDRWWSTTAFIADIKEKYADFQRPGGDYDSWYLKDIESGDFLRGFEYWDRVDGALVGFTITTILHALAITDLASSAQEDVPSAFRFSKWATRLLNGNPPKGIPPEDAKLHVDSKAHLLVPHQTPRSVRYQISRFCEWQGMKAGQYRYHITPISLARARKQGLHITHLITLLNHHASATLPPNVVKALQGWEKSGTQAHFENVTVLHLNSPEILQALRQSRGSRFLGNPLGPTAIIVNPGAWPQVMDVLAELGYLGDSSKIIDQE